MRMKKRKREKERKRKKKKKKNKRKKGANPFSTASLVIPFSELTAFDQSLDKILVALKLYDVPPVEICNI